MAAPCHPQVADLGKCRGPFLGRKASSPMPSDPWKFDDGARRLERQEILTQSSDKRGHHSTIRADVPPDISSKVGALVASKLIAEYRTSNDFVRDAVYHRLQDIEDMMPGWLAGWPTLLTHLRAIDFEHKAQVEDEMCERLERLVLRAQRARDMQAFAELEEAIETAIVGTPNTALRERLGELLERLRRVK